MEESMKQELIYDEVKFQEVFSDIKELVIHSRNKVYSTVNIEMLHLYWNIGKIRTFGRRKRTGKSRYAKNVKLY